MALATRTQIINIKATPTAKDIQRQLEQVKRQLSREARLFQQIIVSTWSRLGLAHVKGDMADSPGKLRKVEFERICIDPTSPETIKLKLKINHRTLFGWRSALPYRVRTADLVSEETIYELEKAIDREIRVIDTPDNGVWIEIDRTAGAGGIPKHVPYRETLPNYPQDMSRGTLCLGYGQRRSPHFIDLDDHPHMLIAGATMSGKSNMVNNFICSLMLFSDPDELKFLFVDLKRVEFNFYKRSPHLYGPVITEADAAIEALRSLLQEMDKRTRMFGARECKKLSTWNRLYPEDRLPRVILVIDEFAALRYHEAKKTVAQPAASLVTNITNLGRAVGIHLWVCTQYPVSDVIGNSVRINMPLVIAGRVQNGVQSRVILDNNDAASLPNIPGRMMYQSGLIQNEIQAPFVEDDDVRWAVAIARGKYEGILSLDNDAPQIVFEHLAKFIGDRGGALNLDVGKQLMEYGIPPDAFKRFGRDLIKLGAVTVDGTTYRVTKEENTFRVIPDLLPATTEGEMSDGNTVSTPLRLILPTSVPDSTDGQGTDNQSNDDPQPKPYNPTSEFATECLLRKEHTRTPAIDIWSAYLTYCNQRQEQPMTRTSFGKALGELFDKERKGGSVFYVNVELSPVWAVIARNSAA